MVEREIYSIAFNKHHTESSIQVYIYTLGYVSRNAGRIPKEIVTDGNKIIVTFTDETRHHIPYTDDVEIFDRPIEIKTEDKEEG